MTTHIIPCFPSTYRLLNQQHHNHRLLDQTLSKTESTDLISWYVWWWIDGNTDWLLRIIATFTIALMDFYHLSLGVTVGGFSACFAIDVFCTFSSADLTPYPHPFATRSRFPIANWNFVFVVFFSRRMSHDILIVMRKYCPSCFTYQHRLKARTYLRRST